MPTSGTSSNRFFQNLAVCGICTAWNYCSGKWSEVLNIHYKLYPVHPDQDHQGPALLRLRLKDVAINIHKLISFQQVLARHKPCAGFSYLQHLQSGNIVLNQSSLSRKVVTETPLEEVGSGQAAIPFGLVKYWWHKLLASENQTWLEHPWKSPINEGFHRKITDQWSIFQHAMFDFWRVFLHIQSVFSRSGRVRSVAAEPVICDCPTDAGWISLKDL